MAQQALVPIFGFGTKGKSANVTAQRRINLYLEQGDDKSQLALYSRPGLERKYFLEGAAFAGGGPYRGVNVQQQGNTGVAAEIARAAQANTTAVAVNMARFVPSGQPILTTSGPVQIACVGNETIFVDGVTGYYNGSFPLSDYGVADFPASRSICTLAQRFIVDDPTAVGRFRYSEVGNALSWPALNFATAESAEDPLSLVFSIRGELLLFGTKTIEFWQPTSDPDLPFQAVIGSSEEWGLGFFDSVRDVNGTCMFVGRAGGAGQPQVCMLNGYQVQVVSTPDVDDAIGLEVEAGAVPCATVVTHSGHAWYVLNMKNTSFAYDTLNGTWCEWQTEGARWAGQYSFTYRGITFVTDYRDGRVYVLDADRYQDDTAPIVREIQTKHVAANNDRLSASELAVEFEYGTGLISGQGSDPQVMLQVSRDNGHTWGAELWRSLGTMGQYAKRVFWTRLGRSRDFVFRLRIADPVKVVIVNAYMRLSK